MNKKILPTPIIRRMSSGERRMTQAMETAHATVCQGRVILGGLDVETKGEHRPLGPP